MDASHIEALLHELAPALTGTSEAATAAGLGTPSGISGLAAAAVAGDATVCSMVLAQVHTLVRQFAQQRLAWDTSVRVAQAPSLPQVVAAACDGLRAAFALPADGAHVYLVRAAALRWCCHGRRVLFSTRLHHPPQTAQNRRCRRWTPPSLT